MNDPTTTSYFDSIVQDNNRHQVFRTAILDILRNVGTLTNLDDTSSDLQLLEELTQLCLLVKQPEYVRYDQTTTIKTQNQQLQQLSNRNAWLVRMIRGVYNDASISEVRKRINGALQQTADIRTIRRVPLNPTDDVTASSPSLWKPNAISFKLTDNKLNIPPRPVKTDAAILEMDVSLFRYICFQLDSKLRSPCGLPRLLYDFGLVGRAEANPIEAFEAQISPPRPRRDSSVGYHSPSSCDDSSSNEDEDLMATTVGTLIPWICRHSVTARVLLAWSEKVGHDNATVSQLSQSLSRHLSANSTNGHRGSSVNGICQCSFLTGLIKRFYTL